MPHGRARTGAADQLRSHAKRAGAARRLTGCDAPARERGVIVAQHEFEQGLAEVRAAHRAHVDFGVFLFQPARFGGEHGAHDGGFAFGILVHAHAKIDLVGIGVGLGLFHQGDDGIGRARLES